MFLGYLDIDRIFTRFNNAVDTDDKVEAEAALDWFSNYRNVPEFWAMTMQDVYNQFVEDYWDRWGDEIAEDEDEDEDE